MKCSEIWGNAALTCFLNGNLENFPKRAIPNLENLKGVGYLHLYLHLEVKQFGQCWAVLAEASLCRLEAGDTANGNHGIILSLVSNVWIRGGCSSQLLTSRMNCSQHI